MPGAPNAHHPREEQLLWDVERQHLDEAEFMLELWEAALEAPNYTLAEVTAGPEQRLLAHVDALIIGGPLVAERLLTPTIEDPDQHYERAAAATLASSPSEHVLGVLVSAGEGDQRRGIIRALASSADAELDARLIQALDSAQGLGAAALLELLARRQAPVGAWLGEFVQSDDLPVARAATWLARHCSERRVLDRLAPHAQSDDAELRRLAVETALLREVPGAWESALYWAFRSGDSPFRRDALLWVSLLGDAQVHTRVLRLLDDGEHREDALWALGSSGRMSAVDRCIELLQEPKELAPLAAELISSIAGLPTDENRFWRPRPREDSKSGSLPRLQHDDLDRDLVPDAAAALPIPEPEPIARWWQERRAGFDAATRYLGGQVLTGPVLIEALRRAPMRRRHALAMELALRSDGAAVVHTRALSGRQLAQLAQLAQLETVDLQRGRALR